MKVRAIIRIKNDTLYSRRMKLGFTQKKLGDLIGVSGSLISQYENFRQYPKDPEAIRKIEVALGLPIEVLFPEQHHRMVELRKSGLLKTEVHIVKEVFELPEHFVSGTNLLEDPAVMYERKEFKENINRLLDGSELDEREIKVLRMRYYDEMTLQAIGDKFNLTRTRIEQIECRALRKLKHPSRSLEFDAFRAPEDRRKMELEDGKIVDRCLYPFLSFQDIIDARLKLKKQEPYSKSKAIKKRSSGSEDYYDVSCGFCSYHQEYFNVFSLDDLIDRMKKDGWTIKYYDRSLKHRCLICSDKA